MELDHIKVFIITAICAALGGLFAKWPLNRRQVHLENRYKRQIFFANAFFFVGIFFGLYLLKSGKIENNDWRGLGVTFGLMALLPVSILCITSAHKGISGIKETFTAYAINQRMPLILLIVIFILCIFFGVVSTYSLLTN